EANSSFRDGPIVGPLTGQCALIFRWNQFSYRTFCQEGQDHFQLEWQLAWSDPILQGFARRGGLPAATEKLSSRESHSAFFVSCLSGLAGQLSNKVDQDERRKDYKRRDYKR